MMHFLWGKKAKFGFLLLAAMVLLFGMLGSRELWTQEHRWANIVTHMLFSHDYLHPILNGQEYYDKPLLSYWFIAALSWLAGEISLWTLRIPSALAGLIAIWSIYRIGFRLKDKQFGLMAGWLLLTTYFFLFWARVSNADMWNLAGSLFAVAWYFEKKEHFQWRDYAVFFVILALTALCKGLVGPVTAMLVILPHLLVNQNWKKHFNQRIVIAILLGTVIYILPFWASRYFGGDAYEQHGLYEVYRENVLRYFKPFDHKGSIFTYFIYLPIYLLPWTIFFFPALYSLKGRWHLMSANSKWIVWAVTLLFVFFTLSGSRRSYYVLPIVPYAILMTADWIDSGAKAFTKRYVLAGYTVCGSLILFLVVFLGLFPLYYSKGGMSHFSSNVKSAATQIKPWTEWDFALLDAESKIIFYMQLSSEIENQDTRVPREKLYLQQMIQDWPILNTQPKNTIIITRRLHASKLRTILKNYIMVEPESTYLEKISHKQDPNLPVAFIPI